MFVLDIEKDVANNIKPEAVLDKYSTKKRKANIKCRYVNCDL